MEYLMRFTGLNVPLGNPLFLLKPTMGKSSAAFCILLMYCFVGEERLILLVNLLEHIQVLDIVS